MGRSALKVFKKRKSFRKLQTATNEPAVTTHSTSNESVEENVVESSSHKKLNELNKSYDCKDQYEEFHMTNIILELDLLSQALNSAFVCQLCGKNGIHAMIAGQSTGLAVKLNIYCEFCNFVHSFQSSSSHKINDDKELFSVNTRLVYALRSIGAGYEAGKMMCGIMNLPSPPTKFGLYNEVLGSVLERVCDSSMRKAAEEAVVENNQSRDIAVALDGTWQKRGYTSLNGVVSATSMDTGKVIDIAILSKFCPCTNKNKHDVGCTRNFQGSSGQMEVDGALSIFRRSVSKHNVRYLNYLGDGDSKAFATVRDANIYGDDSPVTKLECIGHVMKRMGSRLRRMVQANKGKKLPDGKVLGGRGRLSDSQIDKLQTYYGLAIRRNCNSLAGMRQAIWAVYLHKISTDADPNHGFCPTGTDSWCGYQKAIASKKPYKHKNSLPVAVMHAIKPHFAALSSPDLLKKCLHGRTQNPNESLNHVIWSRIPKTVFVQIKALRLGVFDAVATFNDGNVIKCNVLEELGIIPGRYAISAMRRIDQERLRNAKRATLAATKDARIKKRNKKRALEDENNDLDDPAYGPGLY